jgi:hypothetical protein
MARLELHKTSGEKTMDQKNFTKGKSRKHNLIIFIFKRIDAALMRQAFYATTRFGVFLNL